MSRPLKITVFILVQLVAVLLIVEIVLRVLRPMHSGIRVLTYVPSVQTKNDQIASTRELLETSIIGFSPRTAHSGFVLNSRGFRSREYDDEKAPGVVRILAISMVPSILIGAAPAIRSSQMSWLVFSGTVAGWNLEAETDADVSPSRPSRCICKSLRARALRRLRPPARPARSRDRPPPPAKGSASP